jgi:predicted RecA/RadA family phage recombinase
MQNYIQPGVNMTVPAPADVSSGDLVVVGALVGIAQGDALTGVDITIVTQGVFELPKLEAQAWTLGQKVYWDSANAQCTTVATGNRHIGVAAAAAANPSTAGQVRLGIVA